MKSTQRFPKTQQLVVLAGVVLTGTVGTAMTAAAQDVQDLQTPKSPLVLKSQGSFVVGGETVLQTATEIGGFGGDHIAINQMYVRYMIPEGKHHHVPVVMVHGGTLSGKTYETTPDGRMGWDEYFVRQGHAVYVPDQVSRARSGSLSEILCLRHTMANERSQYAHPQDEESGGRRRHAGVDQA